MLPVVAAIELDHALRVLNAIVPEERSGIAFEVRDYQSSSRVFRKRAPRYADSAREDCRADNSFRFHLPGGEMSTVQRLQMWNSGNSRIFHDAATRSQN